MTLSPILLFHILVGSVSLISGALALIYKKGSPRHRQAGIVFVAAMVAMTTSGVVLAYMRPATIAVIAGALTLYFVLTSLWAVTRKPGHTELTDYLALATVTFLCLSAWHYGNLAAASETGFIEGIEIPAEAYYFFALIAGLATFSDVRYLIVGGLRGAQRVARHLWRMGFAMYIATSSIFTGNPQVFPDALRASGLLPVPEQVVALVTLYWFVKILFWPGIKRLYRSVRARPIVGNPS